MVGKSIILANEMAQSNRIQLRRGTQQEWEDINPVLFIGELGIDISNKRVKAGDGFSNWTQLPYIDQSGLNDLRLEYGNEMDFIIALELAK